MPRRWQSIAISSWFLRLLSGRQRRVVDVELALVLTSACVGGVFGVVDVVVRGCSDGASRRRAESERPRRARRAGWRRAVRGEGAAGAAARRSRGVVDGDRVGSAAGGSGEAVSGVV